jgi:hypothetical protein
MYWMLCAFFWVIPPASEFYIPTFRNTLSVPSSYLPAYEDVTDSVPKRRHIKFRRQLITQKKAHNKCLITCWYNSVSFPGTAKLWSVAGTNLVNHLQNCNHFLPNLLFLTSNFRRVLNVVCFLLGNSPGVWILYADVSEHSVCSIFIGGQVW